MAGSVRLHGSQYFAKNFTTTTCPRALRVSTRVPSSAGRRNSGIGLSSNTLGAEVEVCAAPSRDAKSIRCNQTNPRRAIAS